MDRNEHMKGREPAMADFGEVPVPDTSIPPPIELCMTKERIDELHQEHQAKRRVPPPRVPMVNRITELDVIELRRQIDENEEVEIKLREELTTKNRREGTIVAVMATAVAASIICTIISIVSTLYLYRANERIGLIEKRLAESREIDELSLRHIMNSVRE